MKAYVLKFEVRRPCDIGAVETAFYEHFDGLVSESFGRLLITIYTDDYDNGVVAAKTMALEIQRRLNVTVCRMERDLVDASEIARRIDRTRENVRQLINGDRRAGNPFPTPLGAPNGKKIWEWGVVNEWLRENLPTAADAEHHLSRDEMAAVDGWLVQWGSMPQDMHIRSQFYEITASQSMHSSAVASIRRRLSGDGLASWSMTRRLLTHSASPQETA
ncbi:hypothetical protein ACFXGM_07165 [Streptomyces albidoflavus]